MIRAYTTNTAHAAGLQAAADSKHFALEIRQTLDLDELRGGLAGLQVLIFDLTAAAFSAESVIHVLDNLESDKVPPVLYLLSSPADIEVIMQAGSIINQDYSFVPIEPTGLASRLEVLNMLGARRKLTLESAITDRLTGLYNRKYFIRRLEEELYRAARYQYNVGILLVEVDFNAGDKEIPEPAGDAVMHEIAEFFRERLRKSDIIARYKWDDVAVLLPDISTDDTVMVARDVKSKLDVLKVDSNGVPLNVSVSLGVICFPVEPLGTAVEVIAELEDCCLKAKSGDGVYIFGAESTA